MNRFMLMLTFALLLTGCPQASGPQRFTITLSPTAAELLRSGTVTVTVTVDRAEGFSDAVDVRATGLPPGVSAPSTTIGSGETSRDLILTATASATTGTHQVTVEAVFEDTTATADLELTVSPGPGPPRASPSRSPPTPSTWSGRVPPKSP